MNRTKAAATAETPARSRVRQYADDPMACLCDLTVPAATGQARFGDIMAAHQREWLQALAPALVAVAKGEKPPIGKFFLEGTKGSGKDFLLALCVLWLLAFTKRPLHCQIGAADQDQADELRKSAKAVLRLNRWLAKRPIYVRNWRIECPKTEGEAEIIAADVAGSHGARPDVLILNELHAITKWEFAENMLDNASKVPQGLVAIATNAGFTGSDAFRWREMARLSPRWSFHQFDQPAPWLDAEEIEEARLRNSAERFARLFFGQWSSGSGDCLDPEDIKAAIRFEGPLTGRDADFRQWQFVGGLDLGIKHDHSAFVVLGVKSGEERIRLAWVQNWKPPRGGQVDLAGVERHIVEINQRMHLRMLRYDPHQCQGTAQRLRRMGIMTEEVTFVGSNLDLMATTLMETFRSQLIDLYDHKQLIRDLGRLTIEEKPYGQKLTAISDADGHADTATALAIALPYAVRLLRSGVSGSLKGKVSSGYMAPSSIGRSVQLVRPERRRFEGLRNFVGR